MRIVPGKLPWKVCEHCGKSATQGNYAKWHGRMCVENPTCERPMKYMVEFLDGTARQFQQLNNIPSNVGYDSDASRRSVMTSIMHGLISGEKHGIKRIFDLTRNHKTKQKPKLPNLKWQVEWDDGTKDKFASLNVDGISKHVLRNIYLGLCGGKKHGIKKIEKLVALKGDKTTCVHCSRSIRTELFHKFHGDKCKLNPNSKRDIKYIVEWLDSSVTQHFSQKDIPGIPQPTINLILRGKRGPERYGMKRISRV